MTYWNRWGNLRPGQLGPNLPAVKRIGLLGLTHLFVLLFSVALLRSWPALAGSIYFYSSPATQYLPALSKLERLSQANNTLQDLPASFSVAFLFVVTQFVFLIAILWTLVPVLDFRTRPTPSTRFVFWGWLFLGSVILIESAAGSFESVRHPYLSNVGRLPASRSMWA